MQKKIVLTGAGGFVGARIARCMRERWEILTFPAGMLARAGLQEVHDAVLQMQPDAIIHTAAMADTGECERDPEASYRANVLLTETLCRAAAELGVKAVCYSSDQVYTGCAPAEGPYAEDISLAPANVYGRHKLEVEQRVLSACPDAVMLRASWMYDLPGDDLPIRGNFLCNLLAQARENRAERFSTRDRRGITWVRQAAELTEAALRLPGGVYNFGSPNDRSMADTARDALQALGLGGRAEELVIADEAGRERCLAMDQTKLLSFGLRFDETREGFLRCARR